MVPNPIRIDDLGGNAHYFWFNTHVYVLSYMSQGRSTRCIGDGKPPTFNRASLFHGYINPYGIGLMTIPHYMEIMGV